MAQNEIGKAAMCEIEYQKSRKAGVGQRRHRNKNGIMRNAMPPNQYQNGAMKKQGIGRNADALFSNLLRKIPLPQKHFRKLFTKNHSATDPIGRIR